MKKIININIIIGISIIFLLQGCIKSFSSKQEIISPQQVHLNLTVGQTTMGDVTKVLNPDRVINKGNANMMSITLYHENIILIIHINDNGSEFTKILNLAALRGYFNHHINLFFINGILARYYI